ncbi:unnamed protein product [Calypogeia fissa]
MSRNKHVGQFLKVNKSVHELHRPKAGIPNLEIVFFHGFPLEDNSEDNSDGMFSTWQSEDGSCIWPKTWLVKDFPRAHVLAVSYNAAISLASARSGSIDLVSITEIIMADVLEAIENVRGYPVVFVGYSLGGILIRFLCFLLQKRQQLTSLKPHYFLDNLRGIFFYATPRYGTSSSMETYIESFKPGPLSFYFKALSKEAERINHDFIDLCKKYTWRLAGLGENLPPLLGFFNNMTVVPEASGDMFENFVVVPDADHWSITRPRSRRSMSYVELRDFLSSILMEDAREGSIMIEGAKGPQDFSPFGVDTEKRLLISKFYGSSLPEEISTWVGLQQLEIQHCLGIETLPQFLGRLQRLKCLVISNCPSLLVLPVTLGNLRALRHLRIQDCEKLTRLPFGVGRRLEQLIIWNCPALIEIAHPFEAYGNLRHLLIQGCEGLECLPQSLSRLDDLKHLVIWNCPRLTEIPFAFGNLHSLRHLRIQDCENLEISLETLHQVAVLEYVSISNCSNVSMFVKAYGDELLEARAPSNYGPLKPSPAEQLSTSVITFIAALEKDGRHSYLVSTEWLLSLEEREKEMLRAICMETGYEETYQTASNTYYERTGDHPGQEISSSNDVSPTDAEGNVGPSVDNAASSGTSQASGDLLFPDSQSLPANGGVDMAGSSGVLSATQPRLKAEGIQPCVRKFLQVDCSSPSEDFSGSLPPKIPYRKHLSRKKFGDCLVTFPAHRDLRISTEVEQHHSMPFYKFGVTKELEEDSASLRAFVRTTVSCCFRSDDNPQKVHVEIHTIVGEIKYVDTAKAINHELVLQSVRTSVGARIDHGGDYESIPLRFHEVVRGTKLARTGTNPNLSGPASTTVELQRPLQRSRDIRGDQYLLFDDQDCPATLEGTIDTSLSRNSVLEVDITYQLGLVTDVPREPLPSKDQPFCGIVSTYPVIDFDCVIEIQTKDLLV